MFNFASFKSLITKHEIFSLDMCSYYLWTKIMNRINIVSCLMTIHMNWIIGLEGKGILVIDLALPFPS